MRKVRSVYLSGPDGRLAAAGLLAGEKSAMCAAMGITAVIPENIRPTLTDGSEAEAREVYAARLAALRTADAVICNLTPFRSPSCDPATAFEAGFMSGLSRPVFAYLNVRNEDEADLSVRVETFEGLEADDAGVWRDARGYAVEDYGLPESFMLWAEARRLFVILTADPEHDLTGLQLCLDAIRAYDD